MDIVELHNFSENDFTCKFDNRDYTVPAKDKITLTVEVANHVAFHMAKRVLMDRLLKEDLQFTKDEAKKLAATYITPINGLNTGAKKATEAKLEKAEEVAK